MAENQRSLAHANMYERRILKAIFVFAALPLLIVLVLFYGLFSDLIYTYIETDLGSHFLDRFVILSALILFYYAIFARMVFRFVNRIFGPYERLTTELDQILSGAPKHTLTVREGDFGRELLDRVNQLIQMIPKDQQ